MKVIITLIAALFLHTSLNASELTFKFGSPSFSGNGKSSHYLTIENIEKTRKDAIEAQKKADAKAAQAEIDALPINKFKANIEARFYTAPIGGEVVAWTTPSGTGNVVVTVTETDGTVTTFTMPKEDNS